MSNILSSSLKTVYYGGSKADWGKITIGSVNNYLTQAKVYFAVCNEHVVTPAVVENRVEPDCTTDGHYDNVVYCSECLEEISRETVKIDRLGHTNSPAVEENRVEPDCTTDGRYDSVVYCFVCNAEVSRETIKIDKLGHDSSILCRCSPPKQRCRRHRN